MPDNAHDRTDFTTPPDAACILTLAERAFAALPERLRVHVTNVAIHIEDIPDDPTLDEMGIEMPWDLTGIYRGTPLHLRSVDDIARMPDMIVLYRESILVEWIQTGEDLGRLVASVLVHELAHHFGFSDEDIEALERETNGDEAG
jgi:predicted Zn-dependent protease with MMP-like domain